MFGPDRKYPGELSVSKDASELFTLIHNASLQLDWDQKVDHNLRIKQQKGLISV